MASISKVGDAYETEKFSFASDPLLSLVAGGVIIVRDKIEEKREPGKCSYAMRYVIVRPLAAACFLVLSAAALAEAVVRALIALVAMGIGCIPCGDTFPSDIRRFADRSFIAAKRSFALSLANLFAIYFNFTQNVIRDVL